MDELRQFTPETRAALVTLAQGPCQFPGCRTPILVFLGDDLEVNVETVPIRGNVDTRIRYVQDGELDAVVLAAAGLNRIGRGDEVTDFLSVDTVLPAPGQGPSEKTRNSGWFRSEFDAVTTSGARYRATVHSVLTALPYPQPSLVSTSPAPVVAIDGPPALSPWLPPPSATAGPGIAPYALSVAASGVRSSVAPRSSTPRSAASRSRRATAS